MSGSYTRDPDRNFQAGNLKYITSVQVDKWR